MPNTPPPTVDPHPSALRRALNPLPLLAGTLLCVSTVLAADFTPKCLHAMPEFREDNSRVSAPPFLSTLANAIGAQAAPAIAIGGWR